MITAILPSSPYTLAILPCEMRKPYSLAVYNNEFIMTNTRLYDLTLR